MTITLVMCVSMTTGCEPQGSQLNSTVQYMPTKLSVLLKYHEIYYSKDHILNGQEEKTHYILDNHKGLYVII